MPDPERQKVLDLLQREAQHLRVLDEPEPGHGILGVLPIPGRRAPWNREETPAFVVPDRLDVDGGRRGDLPDGQCHRSALA